MIRVPSTSQKGATYELRWVPDGGFWYCTCPAWRFQKGPVDRRQCKHMRMRGIGHKRPRAPTKPTKTRRPPFMLLGQWDGDAAQGWWLSEKMNGVRLWWDGTRFITRGGRVLTHVPTFFTKALPKGVAVDGELWGGRGGKRGSKGFRRALTAVHGSGVPAHWQQVQFVAFDLPMAAPYTQRYQQLVTLAKKHKFRVVPQHLVRSPRDVVQALQSIQERDGEGVVLRHPVLDTAYTKGRNKHVKKYKGRSPKK